MPFDATVSNAVIENGDLINIPSAQINQASFTNGSSLKNDTPFGFIRNSQVYNTTLRQNNIVNSTVPSGDVVNATTSDGTKFTGVISNATFENGTLKSGEGLSGTVISPNGQISPVYNGTIDQNGKITNNTVSNFAGDTVINIPNQPLNLTKGNLTTDLFIKDSFSNGSFTFVDPNTNARVTTPNLSGNIVNGTVPDMATFINGTTSTGSVFNGTIEFADIVNGSVINGTIKNGSSTNFINGTTSSGFVFNGTLNSGDIVNGSVVNASLPSGSSS